MLFVRIDRPWGPHQPHPIVVGAGLGLRPPGSNQSEWAKCGRDRASHSLIPVLKGCLPIEWTTDDRLCAIPYGIASLHGETKKPIAKNGPGNGLNEIHINLILISNLIFYLEKPIVKFVRIS
ncbi:hypothetical protein [Microcoleus sp. Pol14D5]|uniref:hypothetical protein n=1 Tax=Microcoleus sp. Pol14D5 TaxID=3055401 RepID=UPI002FD67094